MIRSFRHSGLEALFLRGTVRGVQPDHAQRLRMILARLHAGTSPNDMALPGLRLHPLHGRLNGFWSVRVNANWRVIFRFVGQDAFDVDYVDYH